MKFIIVVVLSFGLFGCSLFGGGKRAPERVASCFSEGDRQDTFCKSRRVTPDRKLAITHCIGAKNQEALPHLRGRCAEKICSKGSCQVRGVAAVLDQYADLITARHFAADPLPPPPKLRSSRPPPNDVIFVRAVPKSPIKLASATKRVDTETTLDREEDSMGLVLKPIGKSRSPASVRKASKGKKY